VRFVKLGNYSECWRVWSDKAIDDDVGFCREDKEDKYTCAIKKWKRKYVFVGPLGAVWLKSEMPFPANVCQALNQLIAKRYSKAFGTPHCPPTTWFDFKNDVLFYECNQKLSERFGFDPRKFSISRFGELSQSTGIRLKFSPYLCELIITADTRCFLACRSYGQCYAPYVISKVF